MDIWIFGYFDIWIFGIFDIWIYGYLDICYVGISRALKRYNVRYKQRETLKRYTR